jgi:hypothetical protein
MKPFTSDDLIPLEEYVGRRAEFFEAHRRYCERYRRICIGPALTLLFENRQTLWFRLQEVLRVARLTDPDLIRLELDWYNQLLPGRNYLAAALLVDDALGEGEFADVQVCLMLDTATVLAVTVTSRPVDRATIGAQWLQFKLLAPERKLLASRRRPARFEADYAGEHHLSAYMTEDMRQSLLDDLRLSDRDRQVDALAS